MSLRRNTIANYLGSGYSALVGVVVMPLYLKYLGAEAFGLVGFLVMLQAWLHMLDMGMSQTLAREVAIARGQKRGFTEFGALLRSFEIIFLLIAVAIAAGIYLASGTISREWIEGQVIDQETIAYCVSLMGIIAALRFFASLYSSGIRGMEDQVWLNVAGVVLSSVRVFGALALLALFAADIRLFFQYQVFMIVIAFFVYAMRMYSSLSLRPWRLPVKLDLASLRRVAPFALSLAYVAGIWIVVSQSDKLILSAVLPLREFGYFTIVALISGGILIVTAPITQAILPRMTSLLAERRQEDMVQIYRRASQLVAVIAMSVALILSFYSEALVFAWTGDAAAAKWCADVLPWFALGNGLLALTAFQNLLQKAFGNLRLQVIGSTISAIIQIPTMFYAAIHFGAWGAGIAWFVIRIVWFTIWTAIVHRAFVPGLHSDWIWKDLMPVFLSGIAMILLVDYLVTIDFTASRVHIAGLLMLLGAAQISVMAISSRYVRSSVADYVAAKRATS